MKHNKSESIQQISRIGQWQWLQRKLFIIQVTALRLLLGMANNVSLTIQVSQETFVAGAKTLTRKAPFHLTLFRVGGEAEPHQTVLRVYSSLCVQESLLAALGVGGFYVVPGD